jgi:hypothetical protein
MHPFASPSAQPHCTIAALQPPQPACIAVQFAQIAQAIRKNTVNLSQVLALSLSL